MEIGEGEGRAERGEAVLGWIFVGVEEGEDEIALWGKDVSTDIRAEPSEG